MSDNKIHDIVIIGAGPAGLAAAYELSRRGRQVLCLEKDAVVGGISRTVQRNGFRFDIGGHRFFTKLERVNRLWREVLQDDFLRRNRLSRIVYNNSFFDYPLKPLNALKGLGCGPSVKIFTSYLASRLHPEPVEETFEQWVSNRFGKKLYQTFFKTYTEKVWGRPCSEIDAAWAAQRIKGLSLSSAVKTALFGNRNNNIKTLIDQFDYPKYGPGQMYETMSDRISAMGSTVELNCAVEKLHAAQGRITALDVRYTDGRHERICPQQVISSMPITELICKTLDPQCPPPQQKADQLSYRSMLTVNLMMDGSGSLPDTWVYIHSPEVKVGRVQCYQNWSPFMVPSDQDSSLGLEYFCDENDGFWNQRDDLLIYLAHAELEKLGLTDTSRIRDAFVVRCAKAYPVYDKGYTTHLQTLKDYLAQVQNLQCIGRNGMFKYNNMDHSILSGLLAADNLCEPKHDLWEINTDAQYHEQMQRKGA
ncbi:NAD(P)/FAD-dependent oxidoreductase [Planctomycetota bacterium]